MSLVTILSPTRSNRYYLSFDGDNDVVTVLNTGGLYDLVGSFTLEAGVIVRSYADSASIFDKNSYNQYRVAIDTGGALTTSIRFTDGITPEYFDDYSVTKFTPTLDTLFYFSFVFDLSAEMVYMYINGALHGSKATPAGKYPITSATDLQFGRYSIINTFLDAIIVSPRMWDIARDPLDIAADFNQVLIGDETGLIGYWKMNEGTGSTIYDSTANANHGTIDGATWIRA